jgi:outer membrane protein assembly factor BamE (lipoprotein component of BamABCDE complex)
VLVSELEAPPSWITMQQQAALDCLVVFAGCALSPTVVPARLGGARPPRVDTTDVASPYGRLLRRRTWLGIFALCLTVCSLSGCPYFVPATLDAGSRVDITEKTTSAIVMGKTTRGEVLSALGMPSESATDYSWVTYRSSRTWAAGLAMGAAMGVGHSTVNRLTITFDANGVVSKVNFEQRKCAGPFVAAGWGPDCPATARRDPLPARAPLNPASLPSDGAR